MNHYFYGLLLLLLFSSCQSEPTAITPEFINFEAVANNADDITASRKTEAFRGKVSITPLANEVVIIADVNGGDRSLAYVLQTEDRTEFETIQFSSAWVVFLQDHLLVFDEGSSRSVRLSIQNRALDSQIVNESVRFTDQVIGYGLARYADQVVRKEDLSGVNSYLEARAVN